jgi:threonine-phosphate decarboxylase
MIKGHGDDIYQYEGIVSDFSSNICATTSHQPVMRHLASCQQLLSHYPEPEAWSLEAMLAALHDVNENCIIVTNGATDAIYLIAETFRYKSVIPAPTFSEYEDAYSSFEQKEDKTTLWLCNPNNPDGRIYDLAFIKRMEAAYDLLVIDQSYEHYTNGQMMSVREGCESKHIIQIHSFTKDYAVPGLRLGYITANERLTAAIRSHLRPWSVSSLAIEAGKFLLRHDEFVCRPDLVEAQRLRQQLLAIGIDVMPTQTNFMLCHMKEHDAGALKKYLVRHHGMLIRDASNFHGLTPQHFRVAAQTPVENDALVAAIRNFIESRNG